MLTSEQAIIEYDFATWTAHPDRLTRRQHAHYLGYVQKLLRTYETGIGRSRRELHREVENLCGPLDDCPTRRIAAFCKLLDEASEFQTDQRGKAARLRKQVFEQAASKHPLVTIPDTIFSSGEHEVKRQIANSIGRSWAEIDAELFADVIEFQRLLRFDGYPDAPSFLARYNVAQTQAALYRADHLIVRSRRDHKAILRYAKLARLMHTITRYADSSYQFRLDGPASVLRSSSRYGVAMARFLPGLLACRDWTATAQLLLRSGNRLRMDLSSEDGLSSPVSPHEEYDSDLEAEFARLWGESPPEGWELARETDLLHVGQQVLTPDFTLRHRDGRRFLLEIVGFWTPEYLANKAKAVAPFVDAPLILAVTKQVRFAPPEGMRTPLVFDRILRPQQVIAYIEQGTEA